MRRNNLPDIPICLNLKMWPSSQTLWKVFDIQEINLEQKNISLYNRRSNTVFFQMSEEVISACSLLVIVCHFFMNWNNIFFFFHSSRKISLSKHDLKIVSRSLRIDGSHIFNIWILILSWSRAFSEYKFWISFRMSSLEKVMLDKSLSVLSKSSNSRLLPVLITLHCLANSELHNTALLVKSVTNLFS